MQSKRAISDLSIHSQGEALKATINQPMRSFYNSGWIGERTKFLLTESSAAKRPIALLDSHMIGSAPRARFAFDVKGRVREYAVLVAPLLTLHILVLLVQRGIGFEKYATFGDGQEYINLAKSLTTDTIGVIVNLHPPIYPLAIRIVSAVSSYGSASLLVNAFAQTLTVIPIYETIKLTMPSNQRKLALMLSVFPPATLTYAAVGLSDALTILFSSIFFYSLVKRNESGLIVSAISAELTHQVAYLLVVPLAFFYLKTNPRKIYRICAVAMPFALLSLYMYFTSHDVTYYITSHFVFSRTYWDYPLFSVPFKSLVEAAMGSPIRAGGVSYPVNPISIVEVVFLWFTYLGGMILSWRNRHVASVAYGMPFLILLMFYQVWFFVPRFLAYCFPLLISYGHLIEKRPAMLFLAVALSVAGLVSSLYVIIYALLPTH